MMEADTKPSPEEIRQARADNAKMRERDLAHILKVSEADLAAAHVGDWATRISADATEVLSGLPALGEVMALTRNESAVHEKIGPYEKIIPGEQAALVLGEQIDLRIFPSQWAYGFAIERPDGEIVRRSLQFFDAAGDAVHKIHLRPASNLQAFRDIVNRLTLPDQSNRIETTRFAVEPEPREDGADRRDELRERWSAMTDVHQFFGILRDLDLSRLQALRLAGPERAWRLADDVVPAMFHLAVAARVPIMCFVGNRGCIQIHSGPVEAIKAMGPWINIMDPTFHLHLRTDHIREVWAVRKPADTGHVTSVEVFDHSGRQIIQFFGQRRESREELAEWRALVEALPRLSAKTAA